MNSERDEPPEDDDAMPRQGFWAAMPKRSVSRVLLLLALLAGILYLRQRTAAIAGCMENAFRAAPPAQPEGVRIEKPVVLPAQPREGAPR
ncbi:MAG: hypothetical protein JXP73_20175 [Deltaproteobacteria bacterium]|jgi:hypothetical protein|nr:hypothetical protein [Deltaproteobacteria bacterium]